MSNYLMPSRQRVPMINAATLEDRTRPPLDGSASPHLRYLRWPTWAGQAGRVADHDQRPTQARLGRR